MKSIVPLILLVLLVIPNQAYPALVNYGTYSYDNATGLNWLHLTETANKSWGEVDTLISPGGSLYGWRFATDLEVETMATALCANPASCSSADFNGWSSDTDGVVNIILGQLGWIGGDHARGVIADVPDGTSNRFEVYMNPYYPTYPGEDYILSAPSSSWRSSSEQHPDMGSFLVSGVVPIPGAVWLLGSGLIGIVGVRRKFKK